MSLELWNQRFADAGDAFVFGEQPSHFLEAEAHRLPAGARVLSVADGEGRNSVWLARRGHRVHAVEFSPVALAKAARFAEREGVAVAFERVDVLEWTWPEAVYDAVVAIFVQFAAPTERPRLFDGLRAAVRPGGLLMLHGYTPKQVDYGTGGPPDPTHMYTEAMLASAFGAMEILSLRAYEQEIREGEGHHGRSALIDLVARQPD
ncbi:MAG: class I SAM-dependent methyltransferase [Rhodocyclaceae bacterium]|nr:class I SAM-dependent methyltransferase [Rhodocyclaceae bacterium]